MMRINRFLATCGVASRRAAEEIIAAGRVSINGKRVTELGVTVDETRDVVRLDGKELRVTAKKVYVLLNKRKGVITTANDELGRKNVFDIVQVEERIFPVGRLDRNSEGLLLLTNDGEMANRLLHPSRQVYKTYRVKLDKPFKEKDFEPLESGIELEDGKSAPCRARFYAEETDRIELQIHEGRNHIVRRMLAALGYEVTALKRTQFGPLKIGGLARGQWRLLSPTELHLLRKAAGTLKQQEKRQDSKAEHRSTRSVSDRSMPRAAKAGAAKVFDKKAKHPDSNSKRPARAGRNARPAPAGTTHRQPKTGPATERERGRRPDSRKNKRTDRNR